MNEELKSKELVLKEQIPKVLVTNESKSKALVPNALIPEEIMLQKKVWAVIGATENSKKYGFMIYKKLKKRGYTVYPVNPNVNSVDGDKCYPDLSSLPQVPEVIDMVVPSKIGMTILEEASKLGIKDIWLQPGTFDDDLLELIEKLNLNAVKACVLVSLR